MSAHQIETTVMHQEGESAEAATQKTFFHSVPLSSLVSDSGQKIHGLKCGPKIPAYAVLH